MKTSKKRREGVVREGGTGSWVTRCVSYMYVLGASASIVIEGPSIPAVPTTVLSRLYDLLTCDSDVSKRGIPCLFSTARPAPPFEMGTAGVVLGDSQRRCVECQWSPRKMGLMNIDTALGLQIGTSFIEASSNALGIFAIPHPTSRKLHRTT